MATICITGRLGRDGELKTLSSGTKVVSFSLADDVGWGEKKKTQWIKCALFGPRAEKLAQHLTKGSLVEVSGTPQVETWMKDDAAHGCISVTVNEVKLHGGGKREESDVVQTNAPGGPRRLSNQEAADVRSNLRDTRRQLEEDGVPF